jgi:NADPH-dependent 2,4-dienoyl-CoA reductase/sulfur reductase-like enzyme
MTERLVVIGGDAGGMTAASQAKRMRGDDLEVVAFERGRRTSYAACGIPFFVGGEISELDALVARSPDEHRRRGIDVRVAHEVVGIDLDSRAVEVHDLDGGAVTREPFDQLLIATGARPHRPAIPGIDGDRVYGVQTLDDADRLLAGAGEVGCRRVVVIGAGYIGLEMAEAFTRWGAEVVVVDVADQVMRTLDADMADLVVAAMRAHEIDVRLSAAVQAIEPGRVLLDDDAVAADLVVLGVGVTPNCELARGAGITCGPSSAIAVDRRQRTSAEGVWAAGDCATSFHRVLQHPVHVALGTVANRQSRVAGINIGGGYATFPGVLGTAVTKLCETEIGRTGLTEAEATAAGFVVDTATTRSSTRAGYFPGAAPVHVKLVAERGTGRLLGGQIVGGPGSGKRVDAVATAIWNDMAATDLIDLDLAYAPPFSPVWDPVQTTARQFA